MPRTIMVLIIMFCVHCHTNTAFIDSVSPIFRQTHHRLQTQGRQWQLQNAKNKSSQDLHEDIVWHHPAVAFEVSRYLKICQLGQVVFCEAFRVVFVAASVMFSSKGLARNHALNHQHDRNIVIIVLIIKMWTYMCIVWHDAASNTAHLWWFYNHLLNLSWNSCCPFCFIAAQTPPGVKPSPTTWRPSFGTAGNAPWIPGFVCWAPPW